MMREFWQQHGDAVVLGVILFVAYLVCLVVALHKQHNTNRRKLTRVRAQRDKARAANRRLRGLRPAGPTWATAASPKTIQAEFDALVQPLKGGED